MVGKYTVIIVDDEYRIGILIQKLIHWDKLDLECSGLFQDGESALNAIKEKKPNIVITDIRMPKISGLDLIKLVKETGIVCSFVVISGYKEFEYARKALEYGVEDYIVKPINEDNLNDVLRKVTDKLLYADKQIEKTEETQKTVAISRRIIKRNFLNDIIEQSNRHPSSENNLEENGLINFQGDIFRGVDIKLDYQDLQGYSEKQDLVTIEHVREIIEENLQHDTEEILITAKENLHIYCLFNYSSDNSKSIKNDIGNVLSGIMEYLLGLEQYDVTIGIGCEKKEFSDIRFSILEAYQAVCNRIRFGTGRLIYFESIGKPDTAMASRVSINEQRLSSAVESYNLPEINKIVNEIFSDPEISEIDRTIYYTLGEKLAASFYLYLKDRLENTDQMKADLLNNMQHCNSLEKIAGLFRTTFVKCLSELKKSSEALSVKPIRIAKDYIDQHYSEKIILDEMAAIVKLNPVYFSALFKKETGTTFSNYLLHVRMEHAKELLTQTNDTIMSIALAVGYSDARYFSQTFKKEVGVKPALYRRIHM